MVEGCAERPVVVDTRIIEDSQDGKPWIEEWSIRVCNAPTRVKARFKPGPTGVELNIDTAF
jgi:hypothetical protein